MIDAIEFYMNCETTLEIDCLIDKCKYEWICNNFMVTNIITMFYSEGE